MSERPIGVLALQGSFDLHLDALERAGLAARKVRRADEIEGLAGIILPGGESTVFTGVSQATGLFPALQRAISGGLPAFGTCAGAILLGRGDGGPPERLELAPIVLARNAYGRQAQSFEADLALAPFAEPFHGIFIRAPKIVPPAAGGDGDGDGVEVLGRHDGDAVLARWRHLLLATFHPELTADPRLHVYFAGMCGAASR